MKKILIIILMFSAFFNFFGCKGQSTKTNITTTNIDHKQLDNSIEAFKNRPIFTELTQQMLDSVSDDNLEQTIIDNIFSKQDSIGSNDKNYSIIKSLSKGRQAVFATWGLEAEVNNGGFNQYFYNFSTSGQYAEEAADGFVLIGANKYANLTQRAIDLYMKNIKYFENYKDGTLESFSKSYDNNPLDKLDKEFYALDSVEHMSKLRIDYIRKHKNEFIDK
jgi:hypothetical protein